MNVVKIHAKRRIGFFIRTQTTLRGLFACHFAFRPQALLAIKMANALNRSKSLNQRFKTVNLAPQDYAWKFTKMQAVFSQF
jgi:hypothetical protein